MLLALLLPALAGCSATLTDFERTLAADDSATAALGQWCERRGLAQPPVIRAISDPAAAPVSLAVRQSLEISSDEPVAYRHVRLVCGNRTLSVAHNWYVPSRLTPEMNRALATTDTPFGKVVAPLRFQRERLAQRRGAMEQCPQGTVLSHRARLRTAEGQVISLVAECYTTENIR
jgi:chorismate-pyruvate lyase